ncbi:FecR domain-containing protein [Alcaligenes aquatilis]|uniref:FecR family protein n=1 Tax=Alcaligenes aquatilis TaxID=323284 RepID=UPI002AA88E9E|nr:FecR domain-containing protein [Alcaligenes faecalis]
MSAASGPSASAQHQPPKSQLDELLNQHQSTLQEQFPLPDLEQLAQQASERKRKRERRRAGSCLLILVMAASGLWYWNPAWRHETISSMAHAQQRVTLADGSIATLDRDTHLSTTWRLRSRDIRLEQGRAYFDVSHSAWRPFHVQAGPVQVRVLGTRFAVEHKLNTVAIIVEQGRVQVRDQSHHPDVSHILHADEQLKIDAAGVGPIEAAQASTLLAWQRGQLLINDQPLEQALSQLQAYLPQTLRVSDPALAQRRVSAVFQLAALDQLPALLPQVWSVQLEPQADGSLLVLPAKK